MTGQDVDRLFELLAIFRPKDKHLEDKQLRSAWLFVLKPYAPDDVREAVAEYFRESSYWPDVTDIAKRCPKITRNTRDDLPPADDKHWKKQQEWAKHYDDVRCRRREAGFPETWLEAKEAGGWTMKEYQDAMDEAGLGFELIL